MPASQFLPGIEHVILLMFENRSFDNVLGGFIPYTEDGYGGVPPRWSNPYEGQPPIEAWSDTTSAACTMPYPDPNEDYDDMHDQLYEGGPMKGFVNNYALINSRMPKQIMQYYSPANLPVTYALATNYAVSDTYFASGPVQTWANRLFSLCGTPGYDLQTKLCYLNNQDYPCYTDPVFHHLDMDCIFKQLHEAHRMWKVYYDDEAPLAALLLKYVYDRWNTFEGGHVYPFDYNTLFEGDFFTDVKHDKLPAFSLIEPRYQMYCGDPMDGFLKPPNSYHPGGSTVSGDGPPISVTHGEKLLAKIYRHLASHEDVFNKTLLVVTYDEHGGLFDHVFPPKAVSPFPPDVSNYPYETYGVRVPALFINPYVNRGVYRANGNDAGQVFDHTSLLATLKAQFGLRGSLSPRVDEAATFQNLINPQNAPIPTVSFTENTDDWTGYIAKYGHAGPILRMAMSRARKR